MPKPLKRHVALQPISREHHHALLLAWKIREGLRLNVDPERINKYVCWFWENQLQAHFDFEETYILPILDSDDDSIVRVLREHDRLRRLFIDSNMTVESLSFLEQELVSHIRFEERVLFMRIQEIASPEQLATIAQEHSQKIPDDWTDLFWVT